MSDFQVHRLLARPKSIWLYPTGILKGKDWEVGEVSRRGRVLGGNQVVKFIKARAKWAVWGKLSYAAQHGRAARGIEPLPCDFEPHALPDNPDLTARTDFHRKDADKVIGMASALPLSYTVQDGDRTRTRNSISQPYRPAFDVQFEGTGKGRDGRAAANFLPLKWWR